MGKILSVYFTNELARVCEVRKSGQNVTVLKTFEVPLPSGAVEDGNIIDGEAIAPVLYAAFKNNNIKRDKIAFVIASRRIANKEILLPYLKNQSKIEEIVTANAEDYFPMNNLEDYVIRHTVLDTVENESGKQLSVLVMAFHKEMIEGYYQLASLMKMQVETIDYYGNSVYQLLRKQLTQGTILTLQMDRETTYVSIMRGKAQLFKRPIPYGSDTMIKNLAEYKGMTEEAAEEILTDAQKRTTLLDEEEYSELVRVLSSSISRVVEFHTSRNPQTVIEGVKLLGTGIKFEGFAEALSEELGIEVVTIENLNGIKLYNPKKSGLDYKAIVDYIPNLGVLFSPLDLKVEEEKKTSYAIYIVLMVIAALCTGSVTAFVLWQVGLLQEEKQILQSRLEELAEAESAYYAYEDVKNEYEIIYNYYASTKNPTEMLYQMILDMEKMMPESVGIVDISVKNGEVEMTGISDGKDSLAKFVIELKKLPYVTNVRVKDVLDMNNELGGVTSNFNMTWQLVLIEEDTADQNGTEGGAE